MPDRAYYFTVSPTIDLGYNAISPVNFCPGENKTLPCPAPQGAVIPWEGSPAELALPAGRASAGTYSSSSTIYLIGGQTPNGATDSVLTTTVDDSGNFAPWSDGPALPAPRSDAAVLVLSGTPYVIGGLDGSGQPTSTVFVGTVDQGALTGWQESSDLALPVPLGKLSGVATPQGLYIFGGQGPNGLSAATYRSTLNDSGKLTAWTEDTELPLPEARADATAAMVGEGVYVIGGQGPNGPTNTVFYLALDTHSDPAVNPDTSRPFGWGVSVGPAASAALPEARSGQTTFVNSGSLYVIGGFGPDGQVTTSNLWTIPDPATGAIAGWQQMDATDLPDARAQAAPIVIGQSALLIGGQGQSALLTSTDRADVAPRLPFFRLGLFGITVPALSIKGQIGQQLGYIAAGSAGAGDLILLILIGWMFSHRRQSYKFFQWITRGLFRAPPEDDYTT